MSTQFKPRERTSLVHDELEAIRHQRGRSMLLFITDKCPVGCAHCSVDSRPDSLTIENFDLFKDIVTWMAMQPKLEVIGISGGEPFVERRGLDYATREFEKAGKSPVVFTSGVWAKSGKVPGWIETVLARCSTVYLSTDGFHAANISDDCFIRAARAITDAGCWLVVQVLDQNDIVSRAKKLLGQALGETYAKFSEVNVVKPLTHGRGKGIFFPVAKYAGHMLGACPLLRSPMVRYDGKISACCNESVIMGHGPKQLRRTVVSGTQMSTAMAELATDRMLRTIDGVGVGMLTMHPRFAGLADQAFANSCQLCWKILDRQVTVQDPDHLLDAIAALEVSP